MIVVRIELWPWGDKSRKRDIAIAAIANNGAGNVHVGDYQWALSHQFGSGFGEETMTKEIAENPETLLHKPELAWKHGKLEGFGRKRGCFALVGEVMWRAFPKRPYPLKGGST